MTQQTEQTVVAPVTELLPVAQKRKCDPQWPIRTIDLVLAKRPAQPTAVSTPPAFSQAE